MANEIVVSEDLEEAIECLDTLYEDGQDCILPEKTPDWIFSRFDIARGKSVSDPTYDMLRNVLKRVNPDSRIFEDTTASKRRNVGKRVKHNPPLTSIEKASHEDRSIQEAMLNKWLLDCNPQGDDNYFCQSYKLDGVALALYYNNGNLVAAGLRPRNGIDGEDVTEQTKYIHNIPQKLQIPVTCSIRGEIVCLLSDFEKVQQELTNKGEKVRANPRNHATGAIRQFKDPSKTADGRLSFIAHSIEGLSNPPYKTEIDRAKWANQKLGVKFVQIRPFRHKDLQMMEEYVPNLPYEVDGVVLAVNDLESQEQLGRHGDKNTGNPKGKLAWKFAEEKKQPTIKSIEWTIGRTGAIKPVACFDSVRLAGTDVGRATLHNLGFMIRHKIDVGSQIVVLKAGKIIPKVVGVVKKCKGDPNYPKTCPSCGERTILVNGAEDMCELRCNNLICPAQNVNKFCYFLTTLGILGLGASRVEQLVNGGKIKEYADFFTLDLASVENCGLSRRQSLLVLGGIHMIVKPELMEDGALLTAIKKSSKITKQVPLQQFIASLGMPGASKGTGQALASHFQSLDKILSATKKDLEAVEDIGFKTASVISEFFQKNRKEIIKLSKYVEPIVPKAGKLTGKTFCFTGGFSEGGKPRWEREVQDRGGQCKGSVSKKVDFVVVGIDAGEKEKKAGSLGITKLSLEQLKGML